MKVIKVKYSQYFQKLAATVTTDTNKLLTGGCLADILVKYVTDPQKMLPADTCLFTLSPIFVLSNPQHVAEAVRN